MEREEKTTALDVGSSEEAICGLSTCNDKMDDFCEGELCLRILLW
jgi:hypothetical protein